MKQYPSIPTTGKEILSAYVFDKLDGSNLRFEWDQKLGWHKFGTRQQMLLPNHPTFGGAIEMFLETFAQPLEQIATTKRWQNLTAFCEFYGANSFAGFHEPDDQKTLSLLDVQIYKRGLLLPEEFLELFVGLPTPHFLGIHHWNKDFLERVRLNQLEGITFEGVIGKAGTGHGREMQKAKTQAWRDRVCQRFDAARAKMILSS
jgi:hypothetical protein